ncbi:MAG: HAMP domain-containing protein [Anaerolineae bacterium]
MKLQTKIFLSIIGPLVLTVIATAFVTTRGATQSMISQMEEGGITIAQLLARSSNFAVYVPKQVEDIVGDQMVVEARIAAHLVAVAEGRAGMSPDEINAILQDITDNTALDEFWITDETAHAYLRNKPDIDFTFSPDPDEQPQAHIFYPLLSQKDGVVIQNARQREVDPKVFKYAGVSGVDRPRIVQVGYEATFLEELSRDMNAQKLVDELTGQGNVASIRMVDAKRQDLAASTQPIRGIGERLSGDDLDLLEEAFKSKGVRSALREDVLRVAVPLLDQEGQVQVVALVYLLTDSVRAAIQTSVIRSVLVSVAVIVLGAFISFLLSRSITQPVRKLTGAARAIERDERFEPERIASLTKARDELAQLARVFSQMAVEVQTREERLKRQVEELRIEIDEVRKAWQVAEITESEYFQNLQEHARKMRKRGKRE